MVGMIVRSHRFATSSHKSSTIHPQNGGFHYPTQNVHSPTARTKKIIFYIILRQTFEPQTYWVWIVMNLWQKSGNWQHYDVWNPGLLPAELVMIMAACKPRLAVSDSRLWLRHGVRMRRLRGCWWYGCSRPLLAIPASITRSITGYSHWLTVWRVLVHCHLSSYHLLYYR